MKKFMKTAISLALALALLLTSVDTGLFAATVDTAEPEAVTQEAALSAEAEETKTSEEPQPDNTAEPEANNTVQLDSGAVGINGTIATTLKISDFSVAGGSGADKSFYYGDTVGEVTAKATIAYLNSEGKEDSFVPDESTLTRGWYRGKKSTVGGIVTSYVPLDENNSNAVPTEAGTYYYGIRYKDPAGVYADAEAYQLFRIGMIPIQLVPQLEKQEYTSGVKASKIGLAAFYKVINKKTNTDITDEVMADPYFFGSFGYSDNGKVQTQGYVPIFWVEQGTDTKKTVDGQEVTETTWTPLPDDEPLVTGGKYRLIFSGKKAVHPYAKEADPYSGTLYSNHKDINDAQTNYHVSMDPEDVEKLAITFTIGGDPTAVDVTTITNGKADFADPYIKNYDGMPLYNAKGDYKTATVSVSGGAVMFKDDGTRADMNYTWQWIEEEDLEDFRDPESGKIVEPKKGDPGYDKWQDSWQEKWGWFRDTSDGVFVTPADPGVYRLKVTYSGDETHQASEGYAYYVIKRNYAVAKVTGENTVFSDGTTVTAEEVLNFLEDADSGEILPSNAIRVSINFYQATLSEEDPVTKRVTATAGDPIFGEGEEEDLEELREWIFGYSDALFEVEVKGEGDVWTAVSKDTILDPEKTYRVNFIGTGQLKIGGNTFCNDYSFCNKLDDYGLPVEVKDHSYIYYDNLTEEKLNLTKSEGRKLTITVDESKLGKKTYDGKGIDAAALFDPAVTIKDGETPVTDIEKFYLIVAEDLDGDGEEEIYSSLEGSDNDAKQYAIHAGLYHVMVFIPGTQTYAETQTKFTFTVEKAELTLTPTLESPVLAGVRGDLADKVNYYVVKHWTASGLAEGDLYQDVYSDVEAYVYEADKVPSRPDEGTPVVCLKSGVSYSVIPMDLYFKSREDAYGLTVSYEKDYKTSLLKTAENTFTPARAAARLGYVPECSSFLDTKKPDDASNPKTYTHIITTVGAVPFNYDNHENDLRFLIYAPDEVLYGYGDDFNSGKFQYEESIRKAGGEIVDYDPDGDGSCIEVSFNAAELSTAEFEITWMNDYSEKYVLMLEGAELEADLTRAVSPKSLKFNGASSKMAVGDVQQLDVTIGRTQLSDHILLRYKVEGQVPKTEGTEVLAVNPETGYVTALSKGSAIVTVYPCHMVYKNGTRSIVAIEDKPKTASVKITVSDVAAPKISKITASDFSADITYTKPANGYRREIYVLDNKSEVLSGRKPDVKTFEELIAEAEKNRDFLKFFESRKIVLPATENADADAKGNFTTTMTGLDPNGDYTVYVRNVSGLRGIDSSVKTSHVESSAAGSVKTFKTTKPMTCMLICELAESDEEDIQYDDAWVAPFSRQSLNLKVKGAFWDRYRNNTSDHDRWDYFWTELPSQDAGLKKTYLEPKLVFFAYNMIGNKAYYDAHGKTNLVYADAARGKYYYDLIYQDVNENDIYDVDDYYGGIASVDKTGKITLKGHGTTQIGVLDTVSGQFTTLKLRIKAHPDKVTGSSVKVNTGIYYDLRSFLTYTENGVKVEKYSYSGADLDVRESEASDPATAIKMKKDDPEDSAYLIFAQKGNGTYAVDVSDAEVARNGGESTKISFTSNPVESVKNLTVTDVTDRTGKIRFAAPEGQHIFLIQLKDQRGDILFDYLGGYKGVYDEKTKQKVFTIDFKELGLGSVLTYEPKGTYTLLVTPYSPDGSESGKTAMKKFKVTDLPAGYYDFAYEKSQNAKLEEGGNQIAVMTPGAQGAMLDNHPVLKSGCSYTLLYQFSDPDDRLEQNPEAMLRMTDQLTWRSTDNKVASVKVYPGSYTAKLSTMKAGTAYIEVTSKNTKKIVARWKVIVNAVGDGQDSFGDNEKYAAQTWFITDNPINVDVEKDCIEMPLNQLVYVDLKPGEAQWLVFTAPATGSYTLDGRTYSLNKGDRLYAFTRVSRGFMVTGKVEEDENITAALSTDSSTGFGVTEEKPQWFSFRPVSESKTQVYTFTLSGDAAVSGVLSDAIDGSALKESETVGQGTKEVTIRARLDNDTTYYLKVSGTASGKVTVTGQTSKYLYGGFGYFTLGEKGQAFYQYKAQSAGVYHFYISNRDTSAEPKALTVKCSRAEMSTYAYSNATIFGRSAPTSPAPEVIFDYYMEENEFLYLAVYAEGATNEAPVRGTIMAGIKTPEKLTDAGKTFSLKENDVDEHFYAYTAPDDMQATITFASASGSYDVKQYGSQSRIGDSRTVVSGGSISFPDMMAKGDTRWYSVKGKGVAVTGGSITVNGTPIEEITNGKELDLKAGESVCLVWKPEYYGVYNLDFSSDPAVELTAGIDYKGDIITEKGKVTLQERPLENLKPVFLTLSSDADTTVTVHVKGVAGFCVDKWQWWYSTGSKPVSAGNTNVTGYAFLAPEDGTYQCTFRGTKKTGSDEYSQMEVYIYDVDWEFVRCEYVSSFQDHTYTVKGEQGVECAYFIFVPYIMNDPRINNGTVMIEKI